MGPCLGNRYQQQRGCLHRKRRQEVNSPHKFIRACITASASQEHIGDFSDTALLLRRKSYSHIITVEKVVEFFH